MRITVRDAATLLNATEANVYRWIESGALPARRVDEQFRINPSELLEWATSRGLPVDPTLFHAEDEDERIPSVAASLERGGVFHDVPGDTPGEALRAIVDLLPLDEAGDRALLLDLLLAQGASAVVPVGGGVAVPHVRHPIALAADEPSVALFFLRRALALGAPDGEGVFALFLLVSPTTRVHLQMLSKIAFLLRHPTFREAVRSRADAARIVAAARGIEDVA